MPQLPEWLDVLDELLLTVARPRKVHRDGIRFQSLRYVDPVLAAYVGENVTLRYDPRDLAEVRIYHAGKFLCRAVCQELAGETVSLRDITAARRRRKRELKDTLAKRRSLLDVILEKPALPAASPLPAKTAEPAEGETGPRHPLKRYHYE